jgi:hypothetical protein
LMPLMACWWFFAAIAWYWLMPIFRYFASCMPFSDTYHAAFASRRIDDISLAADYRYCFSLFHFHY